MNRICGAFLIAFLTLSICGVAFAKDKCKLGFSPDPMPFDFVEVGQSKTLTVTVTNEGTNNVDITAVGGVEPPFSIASSTCTEVLGPGATCQVMITFSPTVKGAKRDKVHFL
jgi:Abnormal spindle-like microcephaly-assoc'd, ASPM-SPD-2-Hydin